MYSRNLKKLICHPLDENSMDVYNLNRNGNLFRNSTFEIFPELINSNSDDDDYDSDEELDF